MDDFGCINELNCDFNNLSNSINELNETLGMRNTARSDTSYSDTSRSSTSSTCSDENACLNHCYENAYRAGEVNGLQGFGLISKQYQALIILLIILYWWTTQYTVNYFMNSNSQLVNNVSCILDKLVDNAVETCSKCCNTGSEKNSNKKKHCKHKKHCKCCCSSDCDCDSECF